MEEQEELITFKKSEVDKLKETFKHFRFENDRLKREKEELRAKLEPQSVKDMFELEDETETTDTVKNFDDAADVNDLALSGIVHRG